MAIATRSGTGTAASPAEAAQPRCTSAEVWRLLDKASFAVVGYVTPAGEPRSSGVVYKTVGKRVFLAVAAGSWKARHIAVSKEVSVTVPLRRGGILTLVLPIPPATISFHARAIVHPAGSVDLGSLSPELESMLPAERRNVAAVIELLPEGQFLTYGLGISLLDMRKPELAGAVIPVAA